MFKSHVRRTSASPQPTPAPSGCNKAEAITQLRCYPTDCITATAHAGGRQGNQTACRTCVPPVCSCCPCTSDIKHGQQTICSLACSISRLQHSSTSRQAWHSQPCAYMPCWVTFENPIAVSAAAWQADPAGFAVLLHVGDWDMASRAHALPHMLILLNLKRQGTLPTEHMLCLTCSSCRLLNWRCRVMTSAASLSGSRCFSRDSTCARRLGSVSGG